MIRFLLDDIKRSRRDGDAEMVFLDTALLVLIVVSVCAFVALAVLIVWSFPLAAASFAGAVWMGWRIVESLTRPESVKEE